MFGLQMGMMGGSRRAGAGVWSPARLFGSGEQGAWYDPSDWSTLFQDSAGTLPVTAVGQPVGLMLDKSGRGNHASQPTAINRPVIQQDAFGKYYLAFNGTNSWMSTATVDFTATDKMTVVAGVRKLSDAAAGILVELSPNFVNIAGTFAIAIPAGPSPSYQTTSRGSAAASAEVGATVSSFASPHTAVLTGREDISGDLSQLRINGTQSAVGVGDKGTGNFTLQPLYLGARAGSSLFFNGNLYSLVIRGALSDAGQITSAETYANSKTGAY